MLYCNKIATYLLRVYTCTQLRLIVATTVFCNVTFLKYHIFYGKNLDKNCPYNTSNMFSRLKIRILYLPFWRSYFHAVAVLCFWIGSIIFYNIIAFLHLLFLHTIVQNCNAFYMCNYRENLIVNKKINILNIDSFLNGYLVVLVLVLSVVLADFLHYLFDCRIIVNLK